MLGIKLLLNLNIDFFPFFPFFSFVSLISSLITIVSYDLLISKNFISESCYSAFFKSSRPARYFLLKNSIAVLASFSLSAINYIFIFISSSLFMISTSLDTLSEFSYSILSQSSLISASFVLINLFFFYSESYYSFRLISNSVLSPVIIKSRSFSYMSIPFSFSLCHLSRSFYFLISISCFLIFSVIISIFLPYSFVSLSNKVF